MQPLTVVKSIINKCYLMLVISCPFYDRGGSFTLQLTFINIVIYTYIHNYPSLLHYMTNTNEIILRCKNSFSNNGPHSIDIMVRAFLWRCFSSSARLKLWYKAGSSRCEGGGVGQGKVVKTQHETLPAAPPRPTSPLWCTHRYTISATQNKSPSNQSFTFVW